MLYITGTAGMDVAEKYFNELNIKYQKILCKESDYVPNFRVGYEIDIPREELEQILPDDFAEKIPIVSKSVGYSLDKSLTAMMDNMTSLYVIDYGAEPPLTKAQQKLKKAVIFGGSE